MSCFHYFDNLAGRLDRASRAKYQKGVSFLRVGGMKIFRDLIYSMRGVVSDDLLQIRTYRGLSEHEDVVHPGT